MVRRTDTNKQSGKIDRTQAAQAQPAQAEQVSTAGTTVSNHYSLHCRFGLHNSIQATALSAAAAAGGDADTQVYTDCRG